ncbi:MAG: hypothetical protein MR520_00300 [Mollicutes bacterium]|nr:hypothetical protein [Mollicutes bacterium]
MKKILLLSAGLLTLSVLSSCSIKDPTKDFINISKSYFEKARENNIEGELFYYDGPSTRCAAYVLHNDEYQVEYLGLLKFSTLTFSENSSYFFDLGSLDIKLDSTSGSMEFEIGEYFKDGSFDINKFLDEPPFVLVRNEGNEYKYLSGINSNGEVLSSSNRENYDSIFYYLDDFKYDVNEYISFDYTNKKLAILRADILSYFEQFTSSLPSMINFYPALLRNYQKINSLSENQYIPSYLKIDGIKNGKEVVVGPMGFTELFGRTLEDGTKVSNLEGAEIIELGEGIKEATFFAFDNVKSIKSIYLPKSFEKASISSFSNLVLDGLYVNKGEKAITFIDLGSGTMPGFSVEFGPSLKNTKINGSIVFEEYDNPNLSNFPYSSFIFDDNNPSNHIAISKNQNVKTYHSLEEAFTDFDSVSLAYCFNDLSSTIESGSIKEIKENQKLFIEQQKVDTLSIKDALKFKNDNTFSINPALAFKTLKLTSDLVIKGEVTVGGYIGKNNKFESDLSSSFGAIDLNGHTLTIENNAKLINYGLIYDSTLNDSSTNSIIVKEGGILKTNLSVRGYTNSKNAISQIENKVNPFSTYKLDSLRCNLKVERKGKVKTTLKYSDNSNVIEDVFIGEDGFINNSLCEIKRTYRSEYDEYNVNGDLKINTLTIYNTIDTSEFYFPFVNEDSRFVINGKLVVDHNIKVGQGSSLVVFSLEVNANIAILPPKNVSGYDNYLDLSLASQGTLYVSSMISSSLESTSSIGVYGTIDTGNENYSSIRNYLRHNLNKTLIYEEGCLDNNNKNYVDVYQTSLNVTLKSRDHEFNINDDLTYLEKTGSSCTLRKNDSSLDGEILASYSSSSPYWIANVNGTEIITNINKENTLSSFNIESKNYALVDGNWKEMDVEDSNHVYTFDGIQYILVDGKYKQGTLTSKKTFISSSSTYFYNNNEHIWREVSGFENDRILKEIGYSNYYYATLTNYEPCTSYNSSNHYFEIEGKQYIYLGIDDLSTKLVTSEIKDNSDGSKYIYLENQGWVEGDVYSSGKAIVNANTYYYINDRKWIQVNEFDGNTNINNELLYLDTPYLYLGKEYKYALSEINNDSSTRYTNKVSFIDVDTEYSECIIDKYNYSEVWDKIVSLMPSEYESIVNENEEITLHRHFKEDDGKLYLYYEDSEKNITKKAFEFKAGFVPNNPTGGSDILNKFNFVSYEVIFEGETESRTIYLSFDVVGGFTSASNYLAICVFSDTSPVSSLM